MTTAAPARTEELEAKIDALTEQVAFLAEEAARRDRRARCGPSSSDDVNANRRRRARGCQQGTRRAQRRCQISDFADLLRRLVRVAPSSRAGSGTWRCSRSCSKT